MEKIIMLMLMGVTVTGVANTTIEQATQCKTVLQQLNVDYDAAKIEYDTCTTDKCKQLLNDKLKVQVAVEWKLNTGNRYSDSEFERCTNLVADYY